ncbi:MAG: 3-keto-disaccharide hydrolase, partial [Bryobacteraceae bacterium]
VKLLPLGLKPIFNGKDLTGWRKVDPPKPPAAPPEWSVKDGILHVEKGPGQLETEGTWADFVLQLDARANSQDPNRHPNSGVFLRGEPNGYWTGYESQIRNEFTAGDRTRPVDFGTGGIYRYQPARKVMGTDNEFFTKTIVARGRYLAVWVNGVQVSDFEDPNPEGNNVRAKQAKLTPGAISLQAHDPTTNLDFRNLRIVALQ